MIQTQSALVRLATPVHKPFFTYEEEVKINRIRRKRRMRSLKRSVRRRAQDVYALEDMLDAVVTDMESALTFMMNGNFKEAALCLQESIGSAKCEVATS